MRPLSGLLLSSNRTSTFFTLRLNSSNSMLMVFIYLFRTRDETLVSNKQGPESTILQSSGLEISRSILSSRMLNEGPVVAWLLSGCRPGNERWDPHKHRVLVTGWWRAGVIPLTTSNLKSGNSISGSGTEIYRRGCSATEL